MRRHPALFFRRFGGGTAFFFGGLRGTLALFFGCRTCGGRRGNRRFQSPPFVRCAAFLGFCGGSALFLGCCSGFGGAPPFVFGRGFLSQTSFLRCGGFGRCAAFGLGFSRATGFFCRHTPLFFGRGLGGTTCLLCSRFGSGPRSFFPGGGFCGAPRLFCSQLLRGPAACFFGGCSSSGRFGDSPLFFGSGLGSQPKLFLGRRSFRGEPALFLGGRGFRGKPALLLRSGGFGGTAPLFRGGGFRRHLPRLLRCRIRGVRLRGNRLIRLVAAPANLDPDVVAAARGNAVEAIRFDVGQAVFDRAVFFQRLQRIGRQHLRQHAQRRLERELVRRDVERIGPHHDVRPLADVHHYRVAVGTDDRGKKGIN